MENTEIIIIQNCLACFAHSLATEISFFLLLGLDAIITCRFVASKM